MHQSIKFTFIKCPSFKDLRMQEAINIKIKLLSLIWWEKFSLGVLRGGVPRFFYWHFLQLELSRIRLSFVFHLATWSHGLCADLSADRSIGLVPLARIRLSTCFYSKVGLFSPTISWEWLQGKAVKLLASLYEWKSDSNPWRRSWICSLLWQWNVPSFQIQEPATGNLKSQFKEEMHFSAAGLIYGRLGQQCPILNIHIWWGERGNW